MKNLRERSHITTTEAGFIYLTDEGRAIAEKVLERHEFLTCWLTSMGVPEEIAAEDACKLEHVLSPESYSAIKEISKKNN